MYLSHSTDTVSRDDRDENAIVEVRVWSWASWGALSLWEDIYDGQDVILAVVEGNVGRRDGRHELEVVEGPVRNPTEKRRARRQQRREEG